MSDLKELLAGLIRGQRTFEEVSAALDRYLDTAPDGATDAARLLQAARASGLPQPLFVALHTQLAITGANTDSEATVYAGDEADATAVVGQSAARAAPGRCAAPDAEATRFATGDEDATGFESLAGTSCAARVPGPGLAAIVDDDERTAMDGESDETTRGDYEVIGASDFDDLGGAAERTGASWPTVGRGGRGARAGIDRDFQEGDLLRGRFELISKLGEGGMGSVWKGKDKLKEEARDRNPFVAIKMLQGDFKAHPEAFIALQRETAKQQRLAHPNIATVFDFDRDDANGTVFMTMEVLEGQPLDAYIRKLPADGLPEEEAMPLIEQLCHGLGYAHQAGLVHSDLKPGNAFLTKEGNIKLLDFGIARASKTKTDAEGETTLFDPGQLGALTPTYATIEMFEGEDPDPRDDIYALAIMTYQLLTGKHPYGKKSAPKAKELGLEPEPVTKLTKAQNRGLLRGLAFYREDRPDTVEEFLDSLERRKSRTGWWITGTAAALLVTGAGAWGPVQGLLAKQDREAVIAGMREPGLASLPRGLEQARALGPEQLEQVLADERTIEALAGYFDRDQPVTIDRGLALLRGLPDEWRERILDAAREPIMAVYKARIDAHFDPAAGEYAYGDAVAAFERLDRLFPDSASVRDIKLGLDADMQATMANLRDRYNTLLAEGRLIPRDDQEDISDVLSVVRRIDPEHGMLTDQQLPFRFAEEVERAMQGEGDYGRADALLVASTAYAPDDPKLKGLRYDLDRILTRIENERRVAELEERLGEAAPSLAALSDYQALRDELLELATLEPQSRVLARVRDGLEGAFDQAFSTAVKERRFDDGEALLFDYARLLDIADLTRKRIALSEAENAAGFVLDLDTRSAAVKERAAAIEALVATPEFTVDWERRLKTPYKELIALLPLGTPILEEVRTAVARLFIGAAREARSQENFNRARAFVDQGLAFYPGLKNFADERDAIASAEEAFLAKRAAEERRARIESLKLEFNERASADDTEAAKASLAAIRELGVPADDPFLGETAPAELAAAYLRRAESSAASDNYPAAVELASQGLALVPGVQVLEQALARYRAELAKREREIRLAGRFDGVSPIDVDGTRAELAALKENFPERYDDITARLADLRARRLREQAGAADVDVGALATRAREFGELFPARGARLDDELADRLEPRLRRVDLADARRLPALGAALRGLRAIAPSRHAALARELGDQALATVRALERRDKASAARLLVAARKAFPDNEALASLDIVVPLAEIASARAQLARGQLVGAARSLAAARRKAPRHPETAGFAAELAERRKRADEAYARHVAKAEDPLGYKAKDEIAARYREALALCSDCGFRERKARKAVAGLCHPGLAGFGAKRAGQCWDRLGRERGPMMVVVPPGGGSNAAFAIGKYEVSQRDFNVFCKTTNRCKVVLGSRSRLPATGVSAELAEAYARWLSEQASQALKEPVTYRLPTAREWEHAAKADGAQPERTFNCTVMSGGQKIAGHDLVDVRSGKENGWGLTNYVGNAQELVRAGGGFAVRGGDFQVPLTRCDISISEPHNGGADGTTGFRLVRELG